ncbi:heme A synthase [Pedobacter yulinensis]|uniref:Heme A synthase n=1 Tax=Pedobacter yulinensis TaxID=2126353 RepID=A0A2T3HQM8_9SPHI|nr:COX15/CtaA family protein [Pedobacter yulinensis]PST84703.1 heme A synthase [Pedobacter yulinensis]
MINRSDRHFIRLNFTTIIVTLLLILAGGIVRSTGSGMGCPDWPKCFDRYVPPTTASELPAGYEQKYVAQRVKKNERFAKTLDRLGKGDLAHRIRNDKSILEPETFNAAKTWTEYINRLVGALTGFLLLILAVISFRYRKRATRITVLSVLNVFVVAYQAWLGSIVVSTNLLAWVVTVHMVLALVVIGILVYTYHYASKLDKPKQVIMWRINWLKVLGLITILLSIVQIVLGTEVREAIDAVSKSMTDLHRSTWVSKLGSIFDYHRDMAIAVVVANLIVYKMVRDRFNGRAEPLRMVNLVLLALLIQAGSGLALSYLGLPPVAQAVHILFSTVLFSIQYYLYLLVYNTETYKQINN